jgi:hypothetical protein
MTDTFPPIAIIVAHENDDGNYHVEFDMSDEFVEWFKEEHNLKRWSNKRFESWARKNIQLIAEQQKTRL